MAICINDRVDNPSEAGVERYVGLEHLDSDSLRIQRWGAPSDVGATKLLFRKGDIIFGRRRAYQRKLAVADFDGICSAHAMVLRARPEVVLPEFLPFFMQSDLFMQRALAISVGSLSPTINWETLAQEEFALPPIEQQRTLASALLAASRCIESFHDAKIAAERARRALIHFLYTGGANHEPRKDTPLGELPASWEIAPLGERYEVQLGKMISETARGGPHQLPYLRNANVQWNRLDLDDVATMSFSAKEREKFGLKYGDILACEGRHVGKSALWRNEIPGACYQKALHRLRRLGTRDVPEYLLHCIQHYSWAGRFAAETGETTIPHLPAERFRAMLFPFPPRDQQENIAMAIGSCDAVLCGIETRTETGRTLMKGFYQTLE
ncbi:MAG TPA: restriction endonuclease subunit S [Myxococcaceae bacterium]|nr:restriction endonuclease subunit S [Myxococcaceae bacterium]